MQNDDVGAAVEGLEGLDFAKSALVVVDFFEGNWEAVGSPKSSVYVGISAGADALFDVVFRRNLSPAINAPAFGV